MANIKQATGNILTEPSWDSIMGSKVASKAWRAMILLNRLNYMYPKDTASNIQSLTGMTNVPGLGRLFEIKNVHWARRGSRSLNEKKNFEGESTLRRNKLDGNSANNPLTVKDSHRTALSQLRSRGVPNNNTLIDGDPLIRHKAEENNTVIIQEKERTRESNIDQYQIKSLKRSNITIPHNYIYLVNLHTSPYTLLCIQNRPYEVQINPGSTWVSVKSMGRNNPFYMYTGGEDTLSFEVSWYTSDPNHPEEVIAKCRLLESWTKANGYLNAPPTLRILWGDSGLFDNFDFILESCPYRLTNFQNASRSSIGAIGDNNKIVDKKLYPACATQTLTFKKVIKDNTLHYNIIDLPITGIRGINNVGKVSINA